MKEEVHMDKTQAEAAAQAVLLPSREAQEEMRRSKAIQARKLAQQRFISRFALLGLVAGVVIGYFMHKNMLAFLGFGGAVGIVVGGVVASWPGRASRASYSSFQRTR